MQEPTEEYQRYRALYIHCLNTEQFPWGPAYYYYVTTTKSIDIYPYEDFKNSILDKNAQCSTNEEAFLTVTQPMYDQLDEFFSPTILLDKHDQVLMLC